MITVPSNLMRDVSFDTIKMPTLMVIFPQVRVRNYNQLLFGNIAYAMAFVMILPLTMGFFFFNNSIHHRFDRQRPKFTVHHIPREPPACPSTFHSLLLSAFPITENSITLFLYSKSNDVSLMNLVRLVGVLFVLKNYTNNQINIVRKIISKSFFSLFFSI